MSSELVPERLLLPEFIQVLTELVVEHDFHRFFENAAGAAAKLIGADGAALIMLEPNDVLCYRFFLGVPAQMHPRLRNNCFPASWGTAGQALRLKKPCYQPDYPTCNYAMLDYVAAGLKSNLVIPVMLGERAIGVLAISWFYQPGPLSVDENAIQLAQLLANMIGAALHRQQLSNELIKQARQDALTGLGNRIMLTDRLEHAIDSSHRNEHLVAVLVLDIDGFKRINDRMGHAAGDRLLREVATRLRDVVRTSDTLVRLGGDEFVVLLENARTLSEINRVITRIITALKIRIAINGRSEHVSASLGATVYPLDDVPADTLIAHADNAMYVAKNRGGNHYSYFDKVLEKQQAELEKIEQDIRRGLAQNEFVLFFQPIVDSRNGQLLAFESLIRWQHPLKGLLTPDSFIEFAEQTALIRDIDAWVMEEAIRHLAQWHQDGYEYSISVNVSAYQFESRDFTDQLRCLLAAYPSADPGKLKLEIVESLAISDLDYASRVIDECRQLGVLCALDDFGTGYASIAYLRRLSVAVLKIDRSFVDAMLNVKKDFALVQSVVGLASIFELDCIAEGVENENQIRALNELGCYRIQGFYIARPMELHNLTEWVANWPEQFHAIQQHMHCTSKAALVK